MRPAARSWAARGGQDPEEIVDCLEQLAINILIVIKEEVPELQAA
jgi:hypothetical protein